ncbi:MAG: hypothetical protein KatS3mg104_2855 [Phycisphaerae bacterium]|jgi:hypothetical protein|nr:MAG: hypothetical protein KatS3mg104_2855 [Phycisphaerae bacterium]
MWGNLQGWIVAGVLLILMGISGWTLQQINAPTPPTRFGLDPKNLSVLELSVSPGSIVRMQAPGDAGELYLQAIREVRSDRVAYERFVERGQLSDARNLKAVAYILEAAPIASMSLLTRNPEKNIGYFKMFTPEDLADIKLAGKTVERIGLLQQVNGRTEQAKESLQASFALGAKMFKERLIFMEAFEGLGLMNGAAEILRVIAQQEKNINQVATLESFLESTRTLYEQRMKPMWSIISSVGGTPASNRKMSEHAGDIFHFTTQAQQERMWRVESILKLGRFRFHVGGQGYGRLADQTQASARLKVLVNDPDRYVSQAARSAMDLTSEDYHRIQ